MTVRERNAGRAHAFHAGPMRTRTKLRANRVAPHTAESPTQSEARCASADAADWELAMRRGDFTAAFALSDRVLAARGPVRDDPTLPYHLRWVWDGRRFAGRSVIVRCYHGLGDTIQFARYLAVLRSQAATVTLEAQPELVPLLQAVPGPDRLVPFDVAAPLPHAACDIEIMELAHALRLPPQFALRPPYLHIRPAALAPGAVGLCWKTGGWDPARNIPEPLIECLLKEPGLTHLPVFSLHPGPTRLAVANPDGCPVRLEETAAMIAGLWLVITADTMIAHLAGALNRPTWLLLKHVADWRWMEGRRDSPWYPSMRIYRQPAPGAWEPVIGAVARDLELLRHDVHRQNLCLLGPEGHLADRSG
jgi:hypothetical protein